MPDIDYKNFNTPFLNSLKIKNKADLFRKGFWDNSIPVDIEEIIDPKLGLDIIPIKGLMK